MRHVVPGTNRRAPRQVGFPEWNYIRTVARARTDYRNADVPVDRGAKLEWARPGRRSAEDCGGYLGVLGLSIICFMKSIAASAVGWPEGVAMYSASVSS